MNNRQPLFLGVEYAKMIGVLLDSFVYLKGIPLWLGEPNGVYYTTTTATALLALHHANALNGKQYHEFHETLFWLRDFTPNSHGTSKLPEDTVAWEVSEGASVWATALAIWALLGTGYKGERMNEIGDAIKWLLQHQKPEDGGWGYDSRTNSRVIFTSVTLHVLKLFLSHSSNITDIEKQNIIRSHSFGIKYILANCYEKKKQLYSTATEGQEPDPTSTLCALWALFETDSKKYHDKIQAGIRYLRSSTNKDNIWEIKPVITENVTKYGVHKVVVTYTPSFVIFLLRAGCSPFDDVCYNSIKWLDRNRLPNGWGIPGVSDTPVSFTTAYAIWTMANWSKYVIKDGLRAAKEFPYVIKGLRKRITLLGCLVITLVTTLLLLETPLAEWSTNTYNSIATYSNDVDLIVNIFACIGLPSIIALIKIADSRVFNNALSNGFKQLREKLLYVIYIDRNI